MIERILPPGVRSAEARADPPDVLLFPAEAKVVARAVQRRRLEFATVRHLARIGLGELGVPAGPILPGHRGAPMWPPGIVGSMTHCPGYRAAAVAPAAEIGGLGIDAEIHEPLPDGVGRLVASEDEQAHLAQVAQHRSHIHWDRLLFGAKECVYKVWSPRTGEWLDFLDASITFDPDAGSFTARLLVPGPFGELHGRFLVEDGLAVTALITASR